VTRAETYNFADLWESVADEVPEREALVCGDRRLTYAQLEERSNRLAHWLLDRGVQPGDHFGLYLRNGTEYVEGMIAGYKVRAVPININYRYVADELRYLFDDADLVGVIHDAEFGPLIDEIRADLPTFRWNLQVADGSGPPATGGPDYDEALAASSPERDFAPRSSDDPYVIYTGGTTGMPKGVVWTSEDAFFACLGGGDVARLVGPIESPGELVDRIAEHPMTAFPVPPLMHVAGSWVVFMNLFAGGRVVLLPGNFDPVAVWDTIERERVNMTTLVGDAMFRPVLDAWDEGGGHWDVSSLFVLSSGGGPLSPALRDRALQTLPKLMINDGYGSSETGIQAGIRFTSDTKVEGPTRFVPSTAVVLDPDTLQSVAPGSGEVGRVARTGRIPQGYYKDPEKTAATFVEYDGKRWALSGDMATVEADGSVTVLGRGSQCINTGGEKVYPEEVEAALRAHADVYDVLVVGVPDERWGQAVTAVVEPTPGASPTEDDLRAACRASVAGYKVPKRVVFVDHVVRSPSGKADYRWAARVAAEAVLSS
jgi:acyl-CoA synthetase (AMP-forming)/AMP-acid ligase II